MYKITNCIHAPEEVEEMYRRYNFILRDLDSNVQRLDEGPQVPKYSTCDLIYNTENNSFCIFKAEPVGVPLDTIKLYIYEFYAPNCGYDLLVALFEYLEEQRIAAKPTRFDIYLDIIDTNTRAKKFWLKYLGKPYTVEKDEYWITRYNFFLEHNMESENGE